MTGKTANAQTLNDQDKLEFETEGETTIMNNMESISCTCYYVDLIHCLRFWKQVFGISWVTLFGKLIVNVRTNNIYVFIYEEGLI